RAKLRIPGEEDERAPVAAKSEPNIRETRESPGTGSGRSGKRESRDSRPAKATRDPPHAVAGATSAKKRREVQEAIREVLGEYEHAIEDSPRGYEVDLRGVAFGLALTLGAD